MKNEKMNVMYLNYSLEMGGIETMIVNIARKINENGFNSSICVLMGGGSLEKTAQKYGITIFRMDKKEGLDLRLIIKLRKILKNNGIGTVHTNNYSAWMYGALAAFLLRNVKIINTEHSIVEGPARRYWLEKLLSLITDHVIAVSESVKKGMVDKVGVNENKVNIIENGIDTEKFRPNKNRRKEARKALKIARKEIVVGIVARLESVKNHGLLLDAFEIINRDIGNIRLIIVGNGSLRTKLEERSRKIGDEEKILFLGERKDVEYVMSAMDIFVLSSDSEGMSLTLLEAMSSGLPVVATAVGGNVSTIVDGDTGLLVRQGDVRDMAETIERLIRSKNERVRMGEKARRHVLEKYSEEYMITRYVELYKGK